MKYLEYVSGVAVIGIDGKPTEIEEGDWAELRFCEDVDKEKLLFSAERDDRVDTVDLNVTAVYGPFIEVKLYNMMTFVLTVDGSEEHEHNTFGFPPVIKAVSSEAGKYHKLYIDRADLNAVYAHGIVVDAE